MSIAIKTIPHIDYLEFVITGSYDLNEAIDKFTFVLALCKLTGHKKVLIDYRQLIYQVGSTEKSLYAISIEGKYLQYLQSGGHELQIAYVSPSVTSYEPGAVIGRNIELLQFELFNKPNEALDWLGIKRLKV